MTPDLENSLVATSSAGDLDRMKAMLPSGHESPPSEKTVQHLLETAAKGSNSEVVDFLLDRYPTVQLNEEIVRGAVNTGSIPVFKSLLARDPDIINMRFDMRGTPLVVACQGRQSVEYLRVMLEAGADPNMDPDTSAFPLTLVAYLYGDEGPAAIDLLLQYGARPAGTGALAAAASKGKEDVVLRLLEGGAHPEVEPNAMAGGNYPSPLHLAVSHGHDGVVRLLLQHGADLKATDSDGLTAMEIAKRMQLDGKDVSKLLEALEKQS